MTDNAHQHRHPFDDFINAQLDMAGVDGISFETVAFAMRDVMRDLPHKPMPDLDRLQETLLDCLNVEAIGRLIQHNPELAKIDPNELDRIVSLTMTLTFVCYNQLVERFGFESPELTQSRQDVQRLWSTLRAASGWVSKAAAEGDTVAQHMANDIRSTLDDTMPPNADNHTRTLPH